MISALDLLNVVADTMRVAVPHAKKVHVERIKKELLPAISIELISYSTPIIDENRTKKTLDLDIIYFSKNNTINEGLAIMERISQAFGLGLRVKDRFIHTSEGPEMKFVNQDMHVLIEYSWYDDYKPLILTEGGHLGEVDTDITDTGNIEKEQGIETDENGKPKPNENGELEQKVEMMELLFIELDEGVISNE